MPHSPLCSFAIGKRKDKGIMRLKALAWSWGMFERLKNLTGLHGGSGTQVMQKPKTGGGGGSQIGDRGRGREREI